MRFCGKKQAEETFENPSLGEITKVDYQPSEIDILHESFIQ
jgi:hypothetical protein